MRSKNMRTIALLYLVVGVLAVVGLCIVAFSCGGCIPHAKIPDVVAIQPTQPTMLNKILSPTQGDMNTITKTVHSTDWLMTAFIVVTVLGAIAGLHGIKSGWLVSAGCVLGAGMKAAFSVVSVYMLSGLVFVGVILVVAVVMTTRTLKTKAFSADQLKSAFKDVVGTVQVFKDRTKGLLEPLIDNTLKQVLGTQKPETQALVKEVKQELAKEVPVATQFDPTISTANGDLLV